MVVVSETAIVETTSHINDERFDNDPDFHHCRLNLVFRVELEWEYETVEKVNIFRYTLVGNEWVPARRKVKRRWMNLKHVTLIVPTDIRKGEHWLRYREGAAISEFYFVVWAIYDELFKGIFSKKPKEDVPLRYNWVMIHPDIIETPSYTFDYYQKELIEKYGYDAERISSIVDAPVINHSGEICRHSRA